MSKVRTCKSEALFTGKSLCQPDYSKVIGAILVPEGRKLADDIDGNALEELCHASRATRCYPLFTFVEYAPNGGDVATSAVGYGPTSVNGVNAKTDAFTFDQYYEVIAAGLMKTANVKYGVYYVDEGYKLYGLNDGTDVLAPMPMSTVYPTATPHPTSSAKSTLVVNFCHKDARKLIENFDYKQLDFDPSAFAKGLMPVEFVQGSGANKWKLVEKVGGYDLTEEFGDLIATNAADVLNGATAATYANGELTITATGEFSLKDPATLYAKGIKGIEQV